MKKIASKKNYDKHDPGRFSNFVINHPHPSAHQMEEYNPLKQIVKVSLSEMESRDPEWLSGFSIEEDSYDKIVFTLSFN